MTGLVSGGGEVDLDSTGRKVVEGDENGGLEEGEKER